MKKIVLFFLLLATARAADSTQFNPGGSSITFSTNGSVTITPSGTGKLLSGVGVIFSGTDTTFTDNTILRADGTLGKAQKSVVSIDDSGNVVTAGGYSGNQIFVTMQMGISSSSRFRAPVDGNFLMLNSAQSGFSLLQFGGTTSSFPGLKRSSATIEARLADDSAYAPIRASVVVTDTGTAYAITGTSAAPGNTSTPAQWTNILISGTTFKIPLYQ